MTIKPVVVTATQKRGVSNDADGKKESHAHAAHNVEQSGSHAAAHSHAHRNVVIDGHGQSPKRRNETVYDELARHRRSPHKSNARPKRREHHEHLHKRERNEREKLVSTTVGSVSNKCNSPHVHGHVASSTGIINSVANSPASGVSGGGGKSPEHLTGVAGCQSPNSQATVTQAAAGNLLKTVEETYSGYNSGDEHLQPKDGATSADEWQQRDEQFAKCMEERGYTLKPVEEDGACLFRSISLQIYGDEEMHDVIRQHTMDYICKNREYFSHFVTEDINSYIKRKRRKDSHGNHIEIQAMSEIYNRPVEVYSYKPTPINIFNSEQLNNGHAPLRLSYQRGSHYNAIIDPYNATVGVGLGLAEYKPELQTKEAARLSEQLEIEQTMFEDKLKTTDWEATNEAIEEQIGRESYLQWCRENLQKSRATATSSTVTSAEAASDAEASPSKYSVQRTNINNNNHNISGTSGSGSSTATAAAGNSIGSAAIGNCNNVATINMLHGNSSSVTLEQTFATLSPKSLSALAHSYKKESGGGGGVVGGSGDLGFESDDTDMSSTSSMGGGGAAGNASPSSGGGGRVKKVKNRAVAGMRSTKKRRREQQQQQHSAAVAAIALNKSEVTKEVESMVTLRKSPKRDSLTFVAAKNVRALTPDSEQKPSTSKKSSSFSSSSNASTPEKNAADGISGSSDRNALTNVPCSSAKHSQQETSLSSFYQELLEASYEVEGYGQLSESEMLQRAIQMSTQDYIEDQKRKYLYMGHK